MSPSEPFYKEYRCLNNAPLSCDRPLQTAQQVKGAKFCLSCGFPATLPQKAEIKGNRGTYQVISFLGVRGMGRLYSGIQLNDDEPVAIKEYLLPSNCFNAEEREQRQETFKRVAGVSLADGRTQNFRLINPSEAIADQQGERCYLVTKGIEPSQTLSHYLMETGAMTPYIVREVLNQALQTLQFLHTQKLRLPTNQVQVGMAHGNLSLDSILIKEENNQQFYIYLCDLAAWEFLFVPPSSTQPSNPKPDQDLVSLGRVAFYLWVGRTLDHTSGQPLDPRNDRQWPDCDRHLKQFLYRLIGLDTPFDNAEVARQALLQLPKEDHSQISTQSVIADEKKQKTFRKILILGVIALVLVGGGIWYLLGRKPKPQVADFKEFYKLLSTFSDVNSIPTEEFSYTGESNGTWSSVLKVRGSSDRTLEEILTKPRPDVEATFNYQAVPSLDVRTANTPIEEVRLGKKDFAITSLKDSLTNNLEKKQVAYDGLLVYVAFSKKDSNLPKALKGQISLDNLRQIYTGKITNWQQIGGPNLPIRPHAPTEPEAVLLFQQLVLKDDPQQIALFQANVTQLSTEQTQQMTLSEFDEGRVGIISFGILSKTLKQCSVYPLALVDGNKGASQALFQPNGRSIDPSVNLCDKGYYLDVQTFKTQSYPLGYPLYVVYPNDHKRSPAGAKFAELLTTRQGQCLLSKAGLVPLQAVPENYLTSHGCKSVP